MPKSREATASQYQAPIAGAISVKAHDSVIAQALGIMEFRLQGRGDALTSPQAVRDYLRLKIADREHEVFVALFLDSQNRLIAAEEMFRGTLALIWYPKNGRHEAW